MKKPMPASASSAIEADQPPLDPLRGGVTTAKPSRGCGDRTCDGATKEVSSTDSVAPDEVPFSDAAAGAEPQTKTTSGKKCSSGQMSFSSKILLCGGGSGQERESKRKEVDENNPMMAQNPCESSGSTRSRKSSRKGSKKKSKDTIQMKSLEAAKEESDPPAADPASGDAKEIPGRTSDNSNKSCCLCWCCCCCCPCLSVKNGKGTRDSGSRNELSSLEHFFRGNDDQVLPSPEEIKSWGESFDKLMKCPWGRKVFREFLKCEYSEENILFWLACEDLQNQTDPTVIQEKCQAIYDDYISTLSPREVSLDSQVREIINKNMTKPSKEAFAEGQLQIYTLMHRDSYPRFVNSTNYKQLLDVQTDSQSRSAQSTG